MGRPICPAANDPSQKGGEFPFVEPYVDRKQLARMMGVSVATIDRMVQAGMPSETWGVRSRRFQPSKALAWARERARTRATAA